MRVQLGIMAVLGWFALVAQFWISMSAAVVGPAELLIRFFSFFTVTTNILVAVSASVLLFSPASAWGRFFSRQSTATGVCILVVGLIYTVILRMLWQPEGLLRLVDELLLRGAFSGFYPYPFLNVTEIGYPQTFLDCLGVTAVFVVVSLLFIAIGKWLVRFGALLFFLLCFTDFSAAAQSGSEQWLIDNTIKGQTFQEHLSAGSLELRDRNYKHALEHYLNARKLMERDTSNVHRDYWNNLWSGGEEAAWKAGDLKLSQEFSDNAARHNPEPLPALNEKIKKLRAEGIKGLFTFNTFSYGSGASICVDCGCYSNYDRHLFWFEGDSLYIQRFDECMVDKALAFAGAGLAAFYRENIGAMIRERIDKHGSEGHHISNYRFEFYTPDLGAWKKSFNIDNLKAPGKWGNPAIYQSNINTRLSRLLPLVLQAYGKYRAALDAARTASLISWKDTVLINDVAVQETAKPSHADRTNYGSEYARLLKLKNKVWLAAYTVARNKGYEADPQGGLSLEIARSADNGRSWKVISSVSDPGRDLDNAELTLLKDGSVVLACRSVRWRESYSLPVYKSKNKGISWERLSVIDANEGKAGELGKPDQGVYEPHILEMDNGDLAVMYANEKHVKDAVPYSQLIAQKISKDGGRTWGKESWAAYTPGRKDSRPGMPVWTRMKNGSYMLVYEVCGPENCDVYYKVSKDGLNWPMESTRLMFASAQSRESFYGYPNGGPFILSLTDGRLVVTANSGEVSISGDYGSTWYRVADPRELKTAYKQDWTQFIWSSLYQLGPDEIGALSSVKRDAGGHNIQMRIGKLSPHGDKKKQK